MSACLPALFCLAAQDGSARPLSMAKTRRPPLNVHLHLLTVSHAPSSSMALPSSRTTDGPSCSRPSSNSRQSEASHSRRR